MYKGKKVSLVLPAYNEEESITHVISDFSKIKEIDEIVVVDNNSKDKTALLARKTKKAKVVKEIKQGYGYAVRKGLDIAKGDILILCDVDRTYKAEDTKKLLSQAHNFDFVFSTRVHKRYLLKGADMWFIRRWANITLSKMIQFLFMGPSLTDIGATFRLFNRKPLEVIKPYFKVGGGHFQPELTILALLNGFSIKEVPVYYGPRSGTSKIAGSLKGSIKTAKNMLKLIIYYRINSLRGKN